jgi:diaminopimelate decarboxylase
MNHFSVHNGELHCEEVPLRVIAEQVGTPTYVYSAATLTRHYRVFTEAFSGVPHMVCFSVKACSNLSVLRLLANLGSGFDIVSVGELHRLMAAGIAPDKVVFSGVGKTRPEMRAALNVGIHCFNVESEAELRALSDVATELGKPAPVSVRVNPDVDPKTHPYIATGLRGSKFGIPWDQAESVYRLAAELSGIQVVGIDCHIGSQLTSLEPFVEAVDRLLELTQTLRSAGHTIEHLDLGGGLGIPYDPNSEAPPHPKEFGEAVRERTEGSGVTLVFEPGRVIVGNAGVLLMRVLYTKSNVDKSFVIVDAAMNDSIRPALYDAYHELRPVTEPAGNAEETVVDVVGPICESGDFLARDRSLPPLQSDDLMVLMSGGAYGFSMSSNYNSRPRAAEVLVSGETFSVVRERETLADLIDGERIAPFLSSE